MRYQFEILLIKLKILVKPKYRNSYKSKLFQLRTTRFIKNSVLKDIYVQYPSKGLYVDCGSNLGQGYDYFKRWFDLRVYDHVLVEPNPTCARYLKEKIAVINSDAVKLIDKAASTYNGKTRFYGLVEDERGKTSDGGSIVDFHNSGMYAVDEQRAIEVDTFSFSEFISNASRQYKTIVIKMDIEGAEYDVLNDMLDKGVFKHVKALFVEFHSAYMTPVLQTKYKEIENGLMARIKQSGCQAYLWK